jgi:transcriptional regulator with XRE-family HTH domain
LVYGTYDVVKTLGNSAFVRRNVLVHCTFTLGLKRYHVNFDFDGVPMKAVQLRMARAAVRWGVRELAEKANVTANTVTRIENGADAKQSTMDALQRALEAAGIEFTNGEQPGVRLTKAAAARSKEPAGATKPKGVATATRGKPVKTA